MKASQIMSFEEAGVIASVLLAKSDGGCLEVDGRGALAIPQGAKPQGFHMVVAFDANDRKVVVQKDVAHELGSYGKQALSEVENFAKGVRAVAMHDPIQVMRAGGSVWTSWHKERPNRLDIWSVELDGQATLFQAGVITRDNGRTWILLGEYAWQGQLYQTADGGIVGKPSHVKWGSFDVRRTILEVPDFMALVKSATLPDWTGETEELNPPMGEIPGPGFARMQWYKAFAGQTGQGPATLHDGSSAWIHGVDIQGVEPDADGIVRLWQNDLVSFTGTDKFGSQPGKPPKLTGVKLVKRDW